LKCVLIYSHLLKANNKYGFLLSKFSFVIFFGLLKIVHVMDTFLSFLAHLAQSAKGSLWDCVVPSVIDVHQQFLQKIRPWYSVQHLVHLGWVFSIYLSRIVALITYMIVTYRFSAGFQNHLENLHWTGKILNNLTCLDLPPRQLWFVTEDEDNHKFSRWAIKGYHGPLNCIRKGLFSYFYIM